MGDIFALANRFLPSSCFLSHLFVVTYRYSCALMLDQLERGSEDYPRTVYPSYLIPYSVYIRVLRRADHGDLRP